jgi:hypothetical protein
LRVEIIETVHRRRTPTISATAGLNMTRVAAAVSRSWRTERAAPSASCDSGSIVTTAERGPPADAGRHLVFANLAHRRVVESWVDRTVGPEAPLSVGGVYEQWHAAPRMDGPAVVRREVSQLRSARRRICGA